MTSFTEFVVIVSLVLALTTAADVSKKQPDKALSPSRIALNHNETMISEAMLVQPSAAVSTWSQWLLSLQTLFTGRPKPGGCDEWGCGMNHNETMVRDSNR